jgi:hypothetical protein
MKKIFGLEDWIMDPEISDKQRFIDIKIDILYPGIEELGNVQELTPAQRIKKRKALFQQTRQNLLDKKLFDTFESGPHIRHIKTRIPYSRLSKLARLNEIEHIWIKFVSDAKKRHKTIEKRFYCVKMTIVIEIEGVKNGMQKIEENMVLVKAKSYDDAFNVVEKNRNRHEISYLNSEGEIVRWRIDSFDDCYETFIYSSDEINVREGTEVYSKFKTRRMRKEYVWDGKTVSQIKRY